MPERATSFEILRLILRDIRNPDRLDEHPWTRSLIVQELLSTNPGPIQASPGQQLIRALAALFPELQPAIPPRCGKRLDSRWGQFGLLAALYFTPFNHGTSFPTSLMDAWRQIDPAILYFVYGKSAEELTDEQVKRAQLIGAEVEYGAASTLSDWHKKGLQRFTEIVLNRERFLARTATQPSVILEPECAGSAQASGTSLRSHSLKPGRAIWWALAVFLVLALGLSALKGWRIYNRARPVYQDIRQLQELSRRPIELETLENAVPQLRTLQKDLSAFKVEARPLLGFSPRLGWLPVYGRDLAAAPALIAAVEHLLSASLLAAEAGEPLLEEFSSPDTSVDPAGLTALLVEAQPGLNNAREELDRALASREAIEVERLSPRLRDLVAQELDPVLHLADEGLSLAIALPGMVGAGSEGPKTYMLLPQNEDELRPTGGFITSVGNLVVHNGQVISLEFESVDTEQEDWSKPYPAAPWQLQQYMDSPVLILRDANWFTDFPTTVEWVEYLYAYTHYHSVDGIFAFDQQFLAMLLNELGPIELEGVSHPITDQNVVDFMRQAKGQATQSGSYRKEFISEMASALLQRLSNGQNRDWRGTARVFSEALAERHLLLQFDNPVAEAILAEHGLDNAVRAGNGDFLMVTDSNIGFNKTNAVVETTLTYDIDFRDISAPVGNLTVIHENHASREVLCPLVDPVKFPEDGWYPINRCYWNYLRVYKQAGVELLDATPHAIPGTWMLRGETVPPRVDELDEKLDGVQGFGTLLVVPGGKALTTSFTFSLPGALLAGPDDSNQLTYHLKIQKQPGTLAIPVTIRVHLPNRAQLIATSVEGIVQGSDLQIDANLRTDLELSVEFSMPYRLSQE